MEQIINLTTYCFTFFLIHLTFYRLLGININKVFIIILIFLISLLISVKTNSNEIILNLISFNLFVICFYILIPGIINNGPALVIIDLLIKNKICSKQKLKFLFNKNVASTIIKNRLKINIETNIVSKKKNRLFLSNKGKIIIYFFNTITKIFKLKTYE
tara:strand:- start:122 stop:598 length:477 start_codon:yes stop_codon:yes gene_type:complete